MSQSEYHEVIVIGAGFAGISAARTYLKVQPDVDLLIIDACATPGGSWSRERLYPTLRTNNVCPDFEFSDFPIRDHGAELHKNIPGHVVCKYLEYVSDVTGCTKRSVFNVKVTSAIETEPGWDIKALKKASGSAGWEKFDLSCKKLIVACGKTNEPAVPIFRGAEKFDKPNVPFKELANPTFRQQLEDPHVQNVAVIGAGKSGFDAVWYAAEAGKTVDWIIRPNGWGAGWVVRPTRKIGGKIIHKEILTEARIISWISPSIWGQSDTYSGIRNWLHTSSVGLRLVRMLDKIYERQFLAEYDFKNHPERLPLKPIMPPFWKGCSLAGYTFEGDFWGHISSGRVKIHIGEVSSLAENGVINLKDGKILRADALITCAGWRTKIPFSIPSLKNFSYCESSKDYTADPAKIRKADSILYSRFPILKTRPAPPPVRTSDRTTNAFQENNVGIPYRGMVPISHVAENKRKIVFLGFVASSSAISVADLQGLWAVAYLTGDRTRLDSLIEKKLYNSSNSSFESGSGSEPEKPRNAHGYFALNPENKTLQELEFDALLEARWAAMRTPGAPTSMGLDILLDKITYFDMLLKDLGLNTLRKKKGLTGIRWRELFVPYTPKDFKGLIDEWIKNGEKW